VFLNHVIVQLADAFLSNDKKISWYSLLIFWRCFCSFSMEWCGHHDWGNERKQPKRWAQHEVNMNLSKCTKLFFIVT